MSDFERHPDLNDTMLKRLQFLRDSYLGGIDYKKKEYLPRYGNEEETPYNRRLALATYVNLSGPVVELYNNYLFSGGVDRDNYAGLSGAEFDEFLADADMMGRSYEKMVREISKQAGAYGFLGVIVDKPQGDATSKQDELDKGIRPYLAVYVPSSIITYELEYKDGKKQLTRLVLLESTGKKDKTTYKVWYRDRWEIWEKEKNLSDETLEMIDTGINSLNIIPFVSVINRDKDFHPIIGKSDIADIADINNRVYRLDSNADHIMDQCAFPFLQGPKSSVDAIDTLSTTTIVPLDDSDGEAKNGMEWVEPVHASLPQIMAWREAAIEDIKDMSLLQAGQQEGGQAESGIALEIKFRPLNAMLTEKAENMELAETRILTLVGLYMNQTFTGTIEYPREFAIADLMAEVEFHLLSKTAIASRKYKQHLDKMLLSKMLPALEEKEIKEIEAEIDAEVPEIPDTDDINVGGGE